jgi:transcriptional regulator with XRE-family HTH domain
MMQKMQYPNRLKALVKEAGLTIREVHRETGIPESTLRWWANGSGVIPSRERAILARFIGCDIHDLAPLHENELLPQPEEDLVTNVVVSGWNGTRNIQTGQEERVVVGKMY